MIKKECKHILTSVERLDRNGDNAVEVPEDDNAPVPKEESDSDASSDSESDSESS